ncbi:MAG: hypothetical protein KAR19_00850 [Bacteroidales bacterium]|nr:hypothetical protein [Bacteroidales bacterium]
MMKYFSYCLVISMFCVSFSLNGQEVEISIDHPDQVKAGEVFRITVNINKGSLTDYSRFSQDLPPGLTAINVSSPNADFSFDNQRIRIIWLKLPEESKVTVAYNIMVNERLKGSFILGGVFAYVVEDERKFLNFEKSSEITIIPNPSVDPALVVDIRGFKAATESAPAVAEQEVYAMAIRQKPQLLNSGGYLVRLLVKNPSESKYAKIEETIPSGYMFEEVDSHDGIVSFAASTVKFIWMKLPEEPEFEVVYRLVPKRNEPQADMLIEGLLTYSHVNENKLTEVKEVDVAMEDLSVADKRNMLLTGEIPRDARKSSAVSQKETVTTTTPVVKETKPVETAVRQKPAAVSEKVIDNSRMLSAGTGVYFRVQVAANRRAFDARTYFRNAGVDQEVLVEQHDGLYKYTAGSFSSYDQAVAYKKRINRLSSVSGCFVVAYRDGKRIPVTAVRR